jgi:hypothetical protein
MCCATKRVSPHHPHLAPAIRFEESTVTLLEREPPTGESPRCPIPTSALPSKAQPGFARITHIYRTCLGPLYPIHQRAVQTGCRPRPYESSSDGDRTRTCPPPVSATSARTNASVISILRAKVVAAPPRISSVKCGARATIRPSCRSARQRA